jgi:hypothetical protein
VSGEGGGGQDPCPGSGTGWGPGTATQTQGAGSRGPSDRSQTPGLARFPQSLRCPGRTAYGSRPPEPHLAQLYRGARGPPPRRGSAAVEVGTADGSGWVAVPGSPPGVLCVTGTRRRCASALRPLSPSPSRSRGAELRPLSVSVPAAAAVAAVCVWATRLARPAPGPLLRVCSPFQSDGLRGWARRRSARPFELDGGGNGRDSPRPGAAAPEPDTEPGRGSPRWSQQRSDARS